mgnify:CR=1 FL=1
MSENSRYIKEESSIAKAACEEYIALGPSRSLTKLCEALGRPPGYHRTLAEWSTRFGWVERAKAYDQEQLQRKRQARQEAIDDMNTRHAQIGITQQKNALGEIQRLITLGKFKDSALVQLLKIAADLERLARGATLDRINVELTGKDGGPVAVDRNPNLQSLTDEELASVQRIASQLSQRQGGTD